MTLTGDAVDSGGFADDDEYGGVVGAGAFKLSKSGTQRFANYYEVIHMDNDCFGLDKDDDDNEANTWVVTTQAAVCTQRLGRDAIFNEAFSQDLYNSASGPRNSEKRGSVDDRQLENDC